MPRYSVLLVRFSLVWMLLGATFGTVLLLTTAELAPAWLWALRPGHADIMLIGFMLQLALGVALWIFPGSKPGSNHSGTADTPRRFRLLLFLPVLLNAGVVLRVVGGWGVSFAAGPWADITRGVGLGLVLLTVGIAWKLRLGTSRLVPRHNRELHSASNQE